MTLVPDHYFISMSLSVLLKRSQEQSTHTFIVILYLVQSNQLIINHEGNSQGKILGILFEGNKEKLTTAGLEHVTLNSTTLDSQVGRVPVSQGNRSARDSVPNNYGKLTWAERQISQKRALSEVVCTRFAVWETESPATPTP